MRWPATETRCTVAGELERLAGAVGDPELEHVLASEWGMTTAEVRYAIAYADTLTVGEAEPSTAGLDLERAATIRRALDRAWWLKVRRISRRHR